jgi:hypothetical protein
LTTRHSTGSAACSCGTTAMSTTAVTRDRIRRILRRGRPGNG